MSDKDNPANPGANPNPFAAFEGDRTLIKPSAGRAARPGEPPAAAPAQAAMPGPAATGVPDGSALPPHASLNPLVQCAAPLLAAAPRLRATLRHPNPAALREQLAESVRRFESGARAQGLPNEQVVAARYVLCTLLDEAASSTPWGGSGAWSAHSLLVQFHNEGWGGEKVFQLLTRLAENPAQHRNLLELVYVTLSLGFEGRYRVATDGRAQLDDLRSRLATMLRNLAGPVDKALSLQWRGIEAPPLRLRDGVPLWVVAAGTVVLLALVFAALRLALNVQTDATFSALQALDAKTAVAPPAPPPATPPPPRLAQLLQPDIAAGLVLVQDQADRSTVTLPGSNRVSPSRVTVLRSACWATPCTTPAAPTWPAVRCRCSTGWPRH